MERRLERRERFVSYVDIRVYFNGKRLLSEGFKYEIGMFELSFFGNN